MEVGQSERFGVSDVNPGESSSPADFPQTRQLMDQIGPSFTSAPSRPVRRISDAAPLSTGALLKPAISTSIPETIDDTLETTRPARQPRRMRSRIGESGFDFKKSTEF